MNYIYMVTEKNVNGCGGDATEFVSFQNPLDKPASALFARILREAKEKSGGDVSTATMISSAIEQFGDESGIWGRITDAPYKGTFEF